VGGGGKKQWKVGEGGESKSHLPSNSVDLVKRKTGESGTLRGLGGTKQAIPMNFRFPNYVKCAKQKDSCFANYKWEPKKWS